MAWRDSGRQSRAAPCFELGVNHIDTADYYRSGDGAIRANTLSGGLLLPRL